MFEVLGGLQQFHVSVFVPNQDISFFHFSSLVPEDVKAQDGQSSFDDRVPNCPSENKTTPNVNLDGNQNVVMATVHSCFEDTKL